MRAVSNWTENEQKFFELPPFSTSNAEPPSMRYFRLNVTGVVGRPDGRKLLAIRCACACVTLPPSLSVFFSLSLCFSLIFLLAP